MKPLIERVILHSDSDVEYPFQGDPYVPTKTANIYNIAVDPFPGYAHDWDRVRDEVNHVESKFPLGINVYYHCLRHEMIWRSNGAADLTGNEGWVALSGKRIPIHPAITRSLVAHRLPYDPSSRRSGVSRRVSIDTAGRLFRLSPSAELAHEL